MSKTHKITIILLLFLQVWCSSATQLDERKLQQFYLWCKSGGVKFDKIELRWIEQEGMERGVIAKKDLEIGEEILFVPFNVILTHLRAIVPEQRASGYTNLAAAIQDEEFLDSLSQTDLMALNIIYEKNNPDSIWTPYIEMLPKEFTTTTHWSEEELGELQASSLAVFTRRKLKAMERQYNALVADLMTVHPNLIDTKKFTFHEFKWALSAAWSRLFSLKMYGRPVGGLVPFADMFNTDPSNINVQHRMDDDGLTLLANKTIKQGEQLFVPYSRETLSNGQFLMDYGFVQDNNPNRGIMIPSLQPSEDDPLYEAKNDLLQKYGLAREHLLVFDADSLPLELLAMGRINQLVGSEGSKIEKILKNEVVTERNEKAALRTITTHLRRLLAEYSTSIEEDEHILTRSDLSYNKRNAIKLRLQEKTTLNSLINHFEQAREKIY